MVRVAPDMLSRELVAESKLSMMAPVAEPDRRVIVPVPRAIFSEKVRVMLLPAGTFVAPSAGAKESTVGAVVSDAEFNDEIRILLSENCKYSTS